MVLIVRSKKATVLARAVGVIQQSQAVKASTGLLLQATLQTNDLCPPNQPLSLELFTRQIKSLS